ncbi:FAD/NAD(P)-binding domain-containing protein [Coniochaeta sp. PMI_546]|nr:FAD/NAD(P)-binding domain-containing protein [Coniochaeta sp. PMI_546]
MAPASRPLDIITIGGSLAGLMTSISLRRLGHNVRIFERSPTPLLHDQGAGIVAGGDTQDFLNVYDETNTPSAVPSHTRLYLDKEGNVISRESSLQHMTSWDLIYHICRANFDGLKSEYIKPNHFSGARQDGGRGTYQYGRQVVGLESAGSKAKVSFRSTINGENQGDVKDELADFVVIADGASSEMRQLLSPSSPRRTYAGYVAFRGTVPEAEITPDAAAVFVEKFPFFHAKGIQILAYVIPGPSGTTEKGKRKVNWVWYWNVDDSSEEFRAIMTDKHGARHRWSLPPGNNMANDVWETQKQRARELLPPQFAELVLKTESPFVQAVTDLEPPSDGRVWLLDDKAVLVGDCVAGFRPHTAASTSQAAFHALRLPQVFEGEIEREKYEEEVMNFAKRLQRRGVELGNRSQFGSHPFASR